MLRIEIISITDYYLIPDNIIQEYSISLPSVFIIGSFFRHLLMQMESGQVPISLVLTLNKQTYFLLEDYYLFF